MDVRKVLLAGAFAAILLTLGYWGLHSARQSSQALNSGVTATVEHTLGLGQTSEATVGEHGDEPLTVPATRSWLTQTIATTPPPVLPTTSNSLRGSTPNAEVSPTSTTAPPTLSLQPTALADLATVTPANCLLATNQTDNTERVVRPGQAFSHSWRIQNSGACSWGADSQLRWSSGEPFGASTGLTLGQRIAPGEVVEAVMTLVSPSTPGVYISQWILVDTSGNPVSMDAGGGSLVLRIRVEVIPTPTSPPVNTAIRGRVLMNGSPVQGGVVLTLEDQSYNIVARVTVGQHGEYAFERLTPSSNGYNVVFEQATNEAFPIDQVLSWGWIGPVNLTAGQLASLPDFDISLLGFRPTFPEPEEVLSQSSISPAAPLLFTWSPYPGASAYWVDLLMGEAQLPAWQSAFVQNTFIQFPGIYSNGTPLQPDEHWWGVGAEVTHSGYQMTVYGYLAKMTIVP